MRAEPCPDRRSALAAAAIGRLDEHEMLALQAHLDGCAACRNELAELCATADLVAAIDLDHLASGGARSADGGASPALADRVVERVREARVEGVGHHTRRRVGAVVAAVVGLAAAISLVFVVAQGDGPSRDSAAHRTVALHGHDARALATITDGGGGGTDVAFHGQMSDAGGDPYWLWLTDTSGHRLAAATFRDRADGTFSIHGHGAIAYGDVKRVWVTDHHNRVVLDTLAR